MMRVVLVTGKIPCQLIKEIAENTKRKLGVEVETLCLSIPVAAMISAEYLEKELPKYMNVISRASLVMVPGLASGDMSKVREKINVEVVKGPRYAYDIPYVLELYLKGLKLSPIKPADDLLVGYLREQEKTILENTKIKARVNAVFEIGGLPVSSLYPLVLAEVYLGEDLYLSKGILEYADILVLGVPYGACKNKVKEALQKLRETGKPIGLDTADLNLVPELSSYVDLVNAVSVEEIDEIARYMEVLREKAVVITAQQSKAEDRVKALLEAYTKLKSWGFSKIIVDPVLSPPITGLAESIEAYIMVKRKASSVPVLMGVGNVTELSDVDSIGLNALLAFIGVELGVELFLTTEASVKTRNSVNELRRAIDMAVLARELKRPPKDLSINLLYVKSKRHVGIPYQKPTTIIEAVERYEEKPDPRGYFRIYVDHREEVIVAQYYRYGISEPVVEIRSKDPYAILGVIIERGFVSRPDHYFYLGYELAKAEIALITGKEYKQDEPIF